MFNETVGTYEYIDQGNMLVVIDDINLKRISPLVFSANRGGSVGDVVHYLMPTEKYHNLNFLSDSSEGIYYRPDAKRNEVVRVLDAEGMLRIERKNAFGDAYTEADIAYEYRPVAPLNAPKRIGTPRIAMGWMPIDIKSLNFDLYTRIYGTPSASSKGMFTQGILKTILTTVDSPLIFFRQGGSIFFREGDDDDEFDDGVPFGLNSIIRNINVIKEGDKYHVLTRDETKDSIIKNQQAWSNGTIRFIASVDMGGMFTNRNVVNISLYCNDVDDMRVLVGDDLKVIEVESLEDLTEKHFEEFKQHPAYLDTMKARKEKRWVGLRPRKFTWPLLIRVTESSPSLLIRPSVSDIEKLPHTVKILKGVKRNEN